MAGYSGTPLTKKLGIKDEMRVAILAAPKDFQKKTLGKVPGGVRVTNRLAGKTPFDVIVFFAKSRAALKKRFATAVKHLDDAGGLWIAWPKKASGVKTDMTEDVVRDVALPAGLVDNKVCAIDETWSGLRCVIRKENRGKKRRR